MGLLISQEDIKKAFLKECSIKRLSLLLGDDDKAGKFLSNFIILAQSYKNIDLNALAKCCVEIAGLKLSILKESGQAYIVPRGGSINVEIGYKGFLVLAERAGIAVRCYGVFEGDHFEFSVDGFNQNVYFKPTIDNLKAEKDPKFIDEKLQFMIVVAKNLKTGIETTEIIDHGLLKKLKNNGSGSTAYKNWLFEMYKAKAIKYTIRKMPMDSETMDMFASASKLDDENEEFDKNQKKENGKIDSAFDSIRNNDQIVDEGVEVEKHHEVAIEESLFNE